MLPPAPDTKQHKKQPASVPSPPRLTRAQGVVRLSFKRRGAGTVLDEFYQQGCLKARLPAVEPRHITEAVLINTAGGLTDGDRLSQHLAWGAGTTARITSQAAERIYRSRQSRARIKTELEIGKQAVAHYLPQEGIVFNGGRLEHSNRVHMAAGSSLVATESLVFGRTAMNERVTNGHLSESWRIHYDGRLIFADGLRLDGNIEEQLQRRALANGCTAMATLLYAGEDAGKFEAEMKQAAAQICTDDTQIGCSLLPRLLILRILAKNGALMRAALGILTRKMIEKTGRIDKAPLPRVWLC